MAKTKIQLTIRFQFSSKKKALEFLHQSKHEIGELLDYNEIKQEVK